MPIIAVKSKYKKKAPETHPADPSLKSRDMLGHTYAIEYPTKLETDQSCPKRDEKPGATGWQQCAVLVRI
jgi:hypothetical protein